MKINSKVWIEDDQSNYLFGYGVAEILESIDRLGSISSAAKEVGRSYRYTWGRIRKAEEILGTPLIETQVGGRGPNRAQLTPEGKRWLKGFLKLREAVKKTAERYFDKHLADF